MSMQRRHFIALAASATGVAAAPAQAAAGPLPISALGVDAGQFGVRPGSADDQTRALQRALDETARTGIPLAFAPGIYRTGQLKLSTGSHLVGVRGATRAAPDPRGVVTVRHRSRAHHHFRGLVLDGAGRPLPERRGPVQLESCKAVRLADCTIAGSGRNGIVCIAVAGGEVSDSTIAQDEPTLLLLLSTRPDFCWHRNRIDRAGNNGIQVWRSMAGGKDGTLIIDNRLENIGNRSGGSGQYGNAINVLVPGTIVRGNRIDNCAFSAVRGNAASNRRSKETASQHA